MRAAAVAAALALAVSACAADDAPQVRALPAEARLPSGAAAELLGVIELRGGGSRFGGFSGLEVSADGSRIVALSDRGVWLEARLRREGDRLTGLAEARLGPLLGPEGPRAPVWSDSEGLAIPAPDLAPPWFLSLEGVHRVAVVDGASGAERALPPLDLPPPEGPTDDWHGNTGLEALAVEADGALIALREGGDPGGSWRLRPGRPAERIAVPRPRGYSAVGADVGPDGRLYVLGRRLTVPGGFGFAVLRAERFGAGYASPEPLLRLDAAQGADNGEGLAVWRDDDGRIRLLVVTDDNYTLAQRTLLFEFALPARR